MSTLAVTPSRVLRSEWHKLWTLRSTWITLALTSALTIGVGLAIGTTYESGGGDGDVDTVLLVLLGMQVTTITIGVLGVLVIGGRVLDGHDPLHHDGGPAPSSRAVVQGRGPGHGRLRPHPRHATSSRSRSPRPSSPARTRRPPWATRALSAPSSATRPASPSSALMALSLGALIRSVPGSIGALIGGVTVLPGGHRLTSVRRHGRRRPLLPRQVPDALTTAHTTADMASPGPSLLALSLWTLADPHGSLTSPEATGRMTRYQSVRDGT